MSSAGFAKRQRSHGKWRLSLYSALTALVVVAPSAVFFSQPAEAAGSPNLVRNKGFERGLDGWRASGTARPRLLRIHPGWTKKPGTAAARIRATRTGRARLNDVPNTVGRTTKGASYAAAAWVRTTTPNVRVVIRIREIRPGRLVSQSVRALRLTGTAWQKISVRHVGRTTGARLDLNFVVARLHRGKSFDVDGISLRKRSRVCVLNSNLVPSCGVLWGGYVKPGAVAGTTDWKTSYTGMESKVGRKFDIVKRYHDFSNAGNSGAFPDAAERSLAAGGRIPHFAWVSKNYSTGAVAKWADIAAGKYDATVVNPVATRLKNYGGKVFLDFDHEMDGVTRTANGTPAQYVAAYRHLHNRFAAIGATNVVWVWVPTGYLGNVSKIAASYPGDAYVDWIGYDPYNFARCHSTTWRSYESVISGFYNWLKAHGHGNKPFMLAEYGSVAGPTAYARANWFRGQVTALKKYPNIKAIQMFNSSDGGSCNAEISRDAPALDAWGDMGRSAYFNVAH
jgi:hypothetical protein